MKISREASNVTRSELLASFSKVEFRCIVKMLQHFNILLIRKTYTL